MTHLTPRRLDENISHSLLGYLKTPEIFHIWWISHFPKRKLQNLKSMSYNYFFLLNHNFITFKTPDFNVFFNSWIV